MVTRKVLYALPVLLFTLAATGVADAADARIVTLGDAINIALERNSVLQQARNGSALSELAVREARMSFIPDLHVSASASDTRTRLDGDTEHFPEDQKSRFLDVGATSNITLFNGFRDLAALRIAKLGRQASELSLQRLQESTVLTVVSQFLALIQSKQQFDVQKQNLTAALELNRQIEIYVDTGDRPRADLYTQQSVVASARLSVMDAQRSIAVSQAELINTLQLDPSSSYEFPAPEAEAAAVMKDAPLANPAASDTDTIVDRSTEIDSLIQHAWRQRKDIAVQEVQTEVVRQSIPLARPSRWPTVSLGVGYGSTYANPPAVDLTDQLRLNRSGFLTLSLNVPIFNFDSTRYATRRAELQFQNSKIDLQRVHQDVELQVRSAWLNYNAASAQYQLIELQQKTAQLALETAKERYQIGAATLVELSQARVSYLQSESALVNARYNLLFQRTALDYYVGDLKAVSQ